MRNKFITGSCILISLIHLAHAQEPLQPLPEKVPLNADKVSLGARLFHDQRLSGNNTIACSSCHNLSTGGTDHTAVSSGINGKQGEIRAPTVYNSAYNFRQFWNGRAATLQEQAQGPVTNPVEMGANWPDVIKKLKMDPGYVNAFKKIYHQNIDMNNIVDAIAEFERSLSTPSRFDDYLRGKTTAITPQEKHGYDLFKSYGCVACHNGVNIGGGMYQKMGVAKDYFKDRGLPVKPADLGVYQVSKLEKDKHVFKVPSLRNIALTAPYYHDGAAQTLDDAVFKMGKYQLGIEISEKDRQDIIAFLNSLTGKTLDTNKTASLSTQP
ncbi:Cytochrome c551 peroxidase [Aquicella siphonis]|uniref:Cytochrome c551 peroxidase n=1 Tax=Aquicella siphonis TaxID=254247 RepID=A0A5E4PGA3_9COXI|nr:cytochrome-c peroxidase [Aquicella siphonis]VVC75665.1 Cytochrome c551 peroxidase [Aquicella siphonis]